MTISSADKAEGELGANPLKLGERLRGGFRVVYVQRGRGRILVAVDVPNVSEVAANGGHVREGGAAEVVCAWVPGLGVHLATMQAKAFLYQFLRRYTVTPRSRRPISFQPVPIPHSSNSLPIKLVPAIG